MATISASRHGRYEVSIMINGERAKELNAGSNGCFSTYWVESKLGAEFAIHVTEHPSTTSAESRVDVLADGVEVGKAILRPGVTSKFSGSWMNRKMLRPFVFMETNEDARVSSRYGDKLGSIEVKISEVVVYNRAVSMEPPPPLPEFDHTIRGEESLQHRIGLGAAYNRRYDTQDARRFTTFSFDPYSPDPVVVFEIFYRPKVVHSPNQTAKKRLRPEDIEMILTKNPPKRHVQHIKHTTEKQNIQSDLKQKRLFDTLRIPCSRCSESGKRCIRLLGRTACSNCSDRRQGCDLSARNRNVNKKPSSRDSSSTTERNLFADDSDELPLQKLSVPDIIELSSNSSESDTDEHLSDETYEEKLKSEPRDSDRISRRAKIDMFKDVIKQDVNIEDEARGREGGSDLPSVAIKRDRPGSPELRHHVIPELGGSQLPVAERAQAKRLLASLRRWSDYLMVFVADDESRHVAGIAKNLVKDVEERYRSLQADLLKADKRK